VNGICGETHDASSLCAHRKPAARPTPSAWNVCGATKRGRNLGA
jgi:hypothetical protein